MAITVPITTTLKSEGADKSVNDLKAHAEAVKKVTQETNALAESSKKLNDERAKGAATPDASESPKPTKKSSAKKKASSSGKAKAKKETPSATKKVAKKRATKIAKKNASQPKSKPVGEKGTKKSAKSKSTAGRKSTEPKSEGGSKSSSRKRSTSRGRSPGKGKGLGELFSKGKGFGEALNKGATLASKGLKQLLGVIDKALPPPMQVLLSLSQQIGGAMTRWYENNSRLKTSVADLMGTLEKYSSAGSDGLVEFLGDLVGNGEPVAKFIDGITTALGGETEALRKVNKPLAQYEDKTGDAKDAQDEFNDSLERERDLLDEVREGLEDQLELSKARMSREESKLEQDAETALQEVDSSDDDEATKNTKRYEIESKLKRDKYNLRRRERSEELKMEQDDLQAHKDSLKSAQDALSKQQQRAQLARELDEAKKAVDNDNIERNQFLNLLGGDPEEEVRWKKNRERLSEADKLAKENRILDVSEEQKNLPQLEENVRLKQAEVEKLAKRVQHQEDLQTIEQGKDHDEVTHDLANLDREYGRDGGSAVALDSSLPVTPRTPEAKQDGYITEEAALQAASNAIRNVLNDGKGDTSAEMGIHYRMEQEIKEGLADRSEALLKALEAMRQIQTNGSDMERQLTSTLSIYGDKLSQVASRIREIESRINGIELGPMGYR